MKGLGSGAWRLRVFQRLQLGLKRLERLAAFRSLLQRLLGLGFFETPHTHTHTNTPPMEV